jgi:ABC-type multidrug transport system permease subunit
LHFCLLVLEFAPYVYPAHTDHRPQGVPSHPARSADLLPGHGVAGISSVHPPYIFAFDIQQIDLAVWDLDESPLSRRYVAALTADGDLRIREWVDSYEEIEHLTQAGAINGGLVIPPGFEENLLAGQQVELQAVMDGSDPISGNQASASLAQRTAAFSAQFQAVPQVALAGLDVRSEVWYNETLTALISMVPGLTAIVLSMPTLALALALTREKETGSFEGLITTPVRGIEYLGGKLAAYLASGLVSVILVWLVAVLYFRVPFRGSLTLYTLLGVVYLLASMGFSLFVANFVRNQQTAMFLVLMAFFVPSFFVTGLIMPIDHNSLVSQLIAYSFPASHFIAISRGVFLKGLELAPLVLHTLALAGMGLGGLSVSLKLFRKRL